MKLKTFLLSTCVLCSLSTIGFSATVSRDEFRGYVDNHKKLIERVKRAASQGGIDEYQQYRDEFLFHTKEYATLKFNSGEAVLNNANSAKKILHIMISTATKHYLTELSIRHDRVGFYTNYIYSIAQALRTLSDAEYGQILALIDSEITRCERSLLVKKQLRILKGVIEAVKAKLIDISLKGEPRQRLATYHEYEKKMIAIIAREEARKEAESRLAADRSPLFGSRDEESSSRTSGESYDPRRHASLADLERAQKELERLRRQSGAGGGSRALSEVEQEFEKIMIEYNGENDEHIISMIDLINQGSTEKENNKIKRKVRSLFDDVIEEREVARVDNFITELRKENLGKYSGNIEASILEGKNIFDKILLTADKASAGAQLSDYYNKLREFKLSKSHHVFEGQFIPLPEDTISEKDRECIFIILNIMARIKYYFAGFDDERIRNVGVKESIAGEIKKDNKQDVLDTLYKTRDAYRRILSRVENENNLPLVAYLLDIDNKNYLFKLNSLKSLFAPAVVDSFMANIIKSLEYADVDVLKAILHSYYLYQSKNDINDEELNKAIPENIKKLLAGTQKFSKGGDSVHVPYAPKVYTYNEIGIKNLRETYNLLLKVIEPEKNTRLQKQYEDFLVNYLQYEQLAAANLATQARRSTEARFGADLYATMKTDKLSQLKIILLQEFKKRNEREPTDGELLEINLKATIDIFLRIELMEYARIKKKSFQSVDTEEMRAHFMNAAIEKANEYIAKQRDGVSPAASFGAFSGGSQINVSAGDGGERSVAGDSAGNGGSGGQQSEAVGMRADSGALLFNKPVGPSKKKKFQPDDDLVEPIDYKAPAGSGAAPKPNPLAAVAPAAGGGMGGGLLGAIQGGAKPKKKKDPNAAARTRALEVKKGELRRLGADYEAIKMEENKINAYYDDLMAKGIVEE